MDLIELICELDSLCLVAVSSDVLASALFPADASLTQYDDEMVPFDPS